MQKREITFSDDFLLSGRRRRVCLNSLVTKIHAANVATKNDFLRATQSVWQQSDL